MDKVINNEHQRGVCVVRPPGHHAESDYPQGFCIFNDVAIAAEYAIQYHHLKKILIIDWDIHHGNGTQRMFESSNQVLYISLHRYDGGSFYPGTKDGDHTFVGENAGKGYSVNVPWNKVRQEPV